MKKSIDITSGQITFSFEDTLHSKIVFDPARVCAANRRMAMLMGFGHRIGDMAANLKTEDARVKAIQAGVDHYHGADCAEWISEDAWNMRAGAKTPQNAVIAAVAAKRGVTYAEAEAMVAAQFLADL